MPWNVNVTKIKVIGGGSIVVGSMGGAAGTAGTAVAVPLLWEVRQCREIF